MFHLVFASALLFHRIETFLTNFQNDTIYLLGVDMLTFVNLVAYELQLWKKFSFSCWCPRVLEGTNNRICVDMRFLTVLFLTVTTRGVGHNIFNMLLCVSPMMQNDRNNMHNNEILSFIKSRTTTSWQIVILNGICSWNNTTFNICNTKERDAAF